MPSRKLRLVHELCHSRASLERRASTALGTRSTKVIPCRNVPAVRSVKFILAYSLGLIRDSHARRHTMFYTTLASVMLLFIGSVLIDRVLREHPLWFVAWWGLCAWLMVASLLLALFDILMIRSAARKARRDLARKVLAQEPDDHPS